MSDKGFEDALMLKTRILSSFSALNSYLSAFG